MIIIDWSLTMTQLYALDLKYFGLFACTDYNIITYLQQQQKRSVLRNITCNRNALEKTIDSSKVHYVFRG